MSLPAAAPTTAFQGPGLDGSDLLVRLDASVPVLVLPPDMTFEPLRSWLRGVLPAHAATVTGRTVRLDLGPRGIGLFDLRRLVSFLDQEFGVEVTGLYASPEEITRFAERELKLKLFPTALPSDDPCDAFEATPSNAVIEAAVPVESYTPVPAPQRGDGGIHTLPVRRTLRSGTQVRFDGDMHVYGDVNPGAHVVATGNIFVFGALKGVAHAGAHGNERALIVAFDMRPTQLRIARQIAIPSPKSANARRAVVPEVAALDGAAIVVSAFTGRPPR